VSARVLFVYKKSAYQLYVRERKHERFQELVDRHDKTVQHVLHADREHLDALEEAKSAADRLGLKARFRYRSDEALANDHDLVVTIGGDGTLLWASHFCPPELPVLAINSAPSHSVGHFCGGVKGRVEANLRDALEGRLPKTRLSRMEVELDGAVVHRRVLNDALYCHRSPAATTRYLLQHGDVEEAHKSSGLWIGPAAGSTAAIRSAGGKVLPPGSRRLQYVVREPYEPQAGSYRLSRGLIGPEEELVVHSQIREGKVFLDGPHVQHDVPIGARLVLRRSPEHLSILAFPRAEDARRRSNGPPGR
jgi:NAD+ kinase